MINVQYCIIIKTVNNHQGGEFIAVPVENKYETEPHPCDYFHYYILPQKILGSSRDVTKKVEQEEGTSSTSLQNPEYSETSGVSVEQDFFSQGHNSR